MRLLLAATLALSTGPLPAAQAPPAPAAPAAPAAAAPAADESLPPGEAAAAAALNRSPRHGEFVDVPGGAGEAALRAFIVYPERKDPAGVVIVIHEIFGLTGWIRSVADQLAEDGFIAIAPDFLSGKGPGGKGSEALASRDDAVKLVRDLTPAEVDRRLDAVRAYALKLPAANGRVATLGFCWGGARSFGYASAQPALDAAVVFYGTAPDAPALATVKAPVLGLYGGDDARVNATIPATEAELKKRGRSYEVHVYDGAGHGFLRAQDGRDGANLEATRQAWPRVVAFLRQHLARR
jgi:carboxymethylenebutenolidase